jgi:hypothetical protein
MNAVPFDTLKIATKLELAGFSAPQANGISSAMAEAIMDANLATKADLEAVRVDLKGEINVLRTEMRSEMHALHADNKADIAGLRAELRSSIELLRKDTVIRLGSMLFVGFGSILAMMWRMAGHL